MTEASRQKRINQTIKRAQEQGLDVSAKNLVECLFHLSEDEDSDDSGDGDCCLKDLATNQEQNETLRIDMTRVDEDKNHKKEKQVIYHKKGGPNKTKPAKWTQIFSTENKKRKRRAKYVSDTKEKKRQKEEREYIERINDLSKPMPERFWYGRKRLY